jgi:hypothetical protein
MCKTNGELIVHLLLHCEVALEVWNIVCQLFGVVWVMPGSLKECLGSWRAQRGTRTVLQIWRMALLCAMWCLWRKINAQSFEDCEIGLMELKKRVLQTLFSWRVLGHSLQASTLAKFLDIYASFSN